MNVIDRAAEFVVKFEGMKLKSYKCPAGVWTIGAGTTKGVTPNMEITKEQAKEFVMRDLKVFYNSLNKLINYPLNENQTVALLDFVYNLGSGSLQRSTLRMKINRGELNSAANEFLKWNKAGGRILRGLTIRRKAEMELFKCAI